MEIIKNADGTYTLTLEQIKGLEDGDLKLHNDRLYVNGNKSPVSLKFLDNKDVLFTEHRHPDHSIFNQPTQIQKKQLKELPDVFEIKGVRLKGSKSTPEIQTAIKSLIAQIEADPDDHPFTWVNGAEMLNELTAEAKGALLEILNSVIPLKEGMKLEGFSAKEFDEKYFYTSSPLLVERVADHQPIFNVIRAGTYMSPGPLEPTAEDLVPRPIDTNNLVVEDPTYLSVELEGMENSKVKQLDGLLRTLHESSNKHRPETFEQFSSLAYSLFELYCSCVDDDSVEDNWLLAIRLQSQYWDSFRGYTITILRLYVDLLLTDQTKYGLKTPIPGME